MLLQHSIRAGVAAGRQQLVGVHSAASPLLYVCGGSILLNLCARYNEMIRVQHDIFTIAVVQRIPPVIQTSDNEH